MLEEDEEKNSEKLDKAHLQKNDHIGKIRLKKSYIFC